MTVDTLAANRQAVFLRLLRREQAKMTFQEAWIGSDGLVVGSDSKVQDAGHGGKVPEFQPGSDSKFFINSGRGIACCVAGSGEARTIAKNIIFDKSVLEPLESYESHQAWKLTLESFANKVSGSYLAEIIVVRTDTPTNCWKVSRFPAERERSSDCSRVDDFICTGAGVPARFIPRHLWKHQPVSELKKLALLTLAFAERENSWGVGGDYEILSLTSAGLKLERFANAEVRNWAATFLERLQSFVDAYEMNLVSTDVPLR